MRHPIEVRGLGKRYLDEPLDALARVSFGVRPGAITGLVGPASSGKSTLLRILAGRVRASRGFVKVLGCDPLRDARRLLPRVGWVPDHTAFPEGLSLREVAKCLRDLCGTGDPLRFAQLCTSFGLDPNDHADAAPRDQNRFIALALALQKSPVVLLVDEPPVGERTETSGRFLRTVLEHRGEGMSIVLASRRLERIISIADEVLMLRDGRVADRIRPRSQPLAQIARQQLMGAIPAALPSEPLQPTSEMFALHSHEMIEEKARA